MNLAHRVREARGDLGWSQEHLAEVANISVRTVQRIEAGKKPSLQTLQALSSALGIDIPELRRGNGSGSNAA
jgi:transcriptional regulator with XRE-family HTH domain